MNNTIIGTIDTATQLVGEIHQAKHLDGTFSNHEIPLTDYTGQYNYTPTESVQTVLTQYKSLGNNITIQAIPSDYIGSEVARRSESDVTASGDTVTAPSGYYEASVSKTVQAGTATTPTTSQTENPSISVDGSGTVTASYSKSFGITPTVEEGYVTSGTEGTVTVSGSASMQLDTESGKTITPTESAQTAVEENVYTLGEITVAAIPSDYVGSDIPKKSSSDLTASGATVSVPSGFYEESSSKSVQSGTEGTPVATKSEVADHSVTVTPTVTNTEGYISGSTKTGTPVTVSASELVSGTKTITENGENIDVVNYEDVTVNVEGSSVNLESGSATISGAGTVEHTPSVGYDGFDTFTTTTPSASSSLGTSAFYDFGGGNASWNLNHYIDVNSAGWVASGITYGNTVHYGAVQSGTTITPSASSQTIGGENYMMQGAITVESAPLNSASKSYTPTESAQSETITPSSGNYGLDEVSVTVGAIPSNYVGSGIVRRDDTDLYGAYDDGSYDIGGPAGYYQYPFYKTVPSASIYGGYDAVVTPSITVNASGLITVGILEEQDFAFCFGSGWVNASASTAIRVQGYNTLQLTNGNNLEYGLTDATSSLVGVGKVDSMIIE